jgi:hypothetical protein
MVELAAMVALEALQVRDLQLLPAILAHQAIKVVVVLL